MTDAAQDTIDTTHSEWPFRAWITAVILALCGLAISQSSGEDFFWNRNATPGSQAMAAFFFFGGLALAFALERLRHIWAIVYAVVAGLTLGGIAWWVAGYGQDSQIWDWPFAAGLAALAIATPLFQTVRDAGRWRFEYDRLHFHAWTDVVIWFAACAFAGLSWLLLMLLNQLFQLIGIIVIDTLMDMTWFGWVFSGAAFGGALGILRENDRILGTLQRVVLIVLSVLAPPLAIALVLFLFSLVFTGLDTLWDATRATTPILIGCAIGAIILSNAVIRNNDAETSGSRILQVSALMLAYTILPLSIIAAVSVGLRLNQYGLTPERIWGLLVVAIGVAYGLAYLVSAVRGRLGWAVLVRPANTRLAISVCAVLLILALPILDFGAWSARDQVARLNSGETKAEDFDYAAMAYDFGPKGRRLLEQLAVTGPQGVQDKAKKALAATDRWDAQFARERRQEKAVKDARKNVRTIPAGMKISDYMLGQITDEGFCKESLCVIKQVDSDRYALTGQRYAGARYDSCVIRENLDAENPVPVANGPEEAIEMAGDPFDCPFSSRTTTTPAFDRNTPDDAFEIREVKRKQLFINGKAAGDVFD